MNRNSALAFDIKKQCREIITSSTAERKKWLLCNREVPTRLQGKLPRCGLSAISMASELIQKKKADTEKAFCAGEKQHKEELDNLLSMARSKGYSCQGEMYSTENLAQLAREFYGLGCQVISYGFEDHHLIVSELLRGSAVLVPYDADKNHKPCLEKGHKAHWALLTGVLCQLDDNFIDWTMVEQDVEMSMLFHTSPSPKLTLPQNSKPQNIYFCAKHGKSSHTAVWGLECLKRSNANLFELDPAKEKQVGNYIVPEEGIHVGLCGKMLLISDQR